MSAHQWKEVPMRPDRSCGVGSLTFAATLAAGMPARCAGRRSRRGAPGRPVPASPAQRRQGRPIRGGVRPLPRRLRARRSRSGFLRGLALGSHPGASADTRRSTATAARCCCSICSWKCSGRPRQRRRRIARWPVSAASACPSSSAARELSGTPRARLHAIASRGAEPAAVAVSQPLHAGAGQPRACLISSRTGRM